MNIILCVDNNYGMLFNGRRQSRDRVLISDIFECIGEGRILCAPFSETLFDGRNIEVSEELFSLAESGDYCFIEDRVPAPESIDGMIIYHWNRNYPSDYRLNINPEEIGLIKAESVDFIGSSHEKITRERWTRGDSK